VFKGLAGPLFLLCELLGFSGLRAAEILCVGSSLGKLASSVLLEGSISWFSSFISVGVSSL
jgi:hypothetical protein